MLIKFKICLFLSDPSHRITEPLRLEKTFKVIKSNQDLTPPCPQNRTMRCHIHSFLDISMICVWTFNGQILATAVPHHCLLKCFWHFCGFLGNSHQCCGNKELWNTYFFKCYQFAKCPCPVPLSWRLHGLHFWRLHGLHFWFSVSFPWAETSQCVPFAFQIIRR